ncbi:M13 family metallopeptidase [Alloacidobacterium dinghuense]|uniref:M13 family metallopeptidase n=1 Tax=Alloacidobacterium dinghuense TaxID=2763107 RepID=A0A7G8BL30_9BACT|nr:M13 family metallopeptidase [Alloacidobacterium dinghuense]QNI33250.1 M13 family metallopeptidase [Alloacidobacterium dinghuense]
MPFLRTSIVSGMMLAGCLIPACLNAQDTTDMQKNLKALDPKLMDTSADPCVNFYQYSCGGWSKQNPIPADESSYGRGTELENQNRLVLKSILEKAAAGGSERSANEQKIGDYYATCIDVNAVNEAGLKPLQPLLDRIAALNSKDGLPELTAYLDSIGIGTFFGFSSDQDYKDATQQIAEFDQAELGLPEKGYYDRTDDKSAKLRDQYKEHVARTFELLGESHEQAAKDGDTVLKVETELAKHSLTNVERRDPQALYHKMTLANFESSAPNFAFNKYLRSLDIPPVDSLNVTEPKFFVGLNEVLASTDLDSLKAYLRWAAVRQTPSIALPQALDEESFNFYGKILEGQPEQQPRWKRCVRSTDRDLGEALGQVYVAQRFSSQDKQRTVELTHDIEAAMGRDIDQLEWMSPATKTRAKEKLHSVANKIGYPDKWRDYSSLEVVRGDAFGNARRAVAFEVHRQINKIGKPVDRGEWGMTPPTVNAYYNPQMNDINFPAGILQPPYFDPRQDDAVNYGDAGGVIGHELTHGFDDEGRQFDAAGNLKEWWTPEDEKKFTERADCVVKEYDGFVAVDDLHVNGKLTLGENIADLGGLKLAFLAYLDRAQKAGVDVTKKGDAEYGGLTPDQQFFVAFGQSWCQNNRPEDLRLRVQTDPHSPEEFRVNGVVVNLPEFQKAFACQTGQPMAPAKRCAIW